jgi:hypothetical protein
MIPLDELVANRWSAQTFRRLNATPSPAASASPARMVTKYRAPVAPATCSASTWAKTGALCSTMRLCRSMCMAKGLREGIRFVEISVVNLWEDLLDRAQEIQENESTMWYWSVKTTHTQVLHGLLCKITWAGTDIGRAIREWVHDKIFHGMFADQSPV